MDLQFFLYIFLTLAQLHPTTNSPFVEFFLILFQLGICSVYVIFVGSTAKTLIEQHCDLNINVRAYYMISLIPCIIMMMIRDLRQMTPIIFTANMVIILGLAFIYYFVFQNFPSINSVPMFKSVLDVPNFLGICLFALEGIGVVSIYEIEIVYEIYEVNCAQFNT